MAITINGNGTITGISVGGLPDGTVDTDTLANGAVTASKKGSGSVLQVVSMQTDTHSSKTNTSYEDIPGFTLAITPTAASNKILIQATLAISKHDNHSFLGEFQRDGTTLPGGDPAQASHVDHVWWNVRNSTYSVNPYTVIYLDTVPADWTSGAITYKGRGLTTSSSYGYAINQDRNNSDTAHDSPGCSSITLTEIKA
tara:strand:+ start:10 stop:603 length:594 start_codon:yes stop_codon:yes gene_type:complete